MPHGTQVPISMCHKKTKIKQKDTKPVFGILLIWNANAISVIDHARQAHLLTHGPQEFLIQFKRHQRIRQVT